ncbi:MAG: indolepyruvate oxidoreductase subunit beta [Dehalococcoidia bacterium]|nr:indolepyruvate oxidoreductase subunit beta [Dehalococcoidia bacterium]
MAISADPLNLVITGVGGQGNILLSGMLGGAFMKKGYYVTIGETFGAAQRGGAVFSTVRLSQKREYGPIMPDGKAHLIVGLEPLETLRLVEKYGNSDTVVISNTYPVVTASVSSGQDTYPDMAELKKAVESLCKEAYFIDATSIALDINAPIALNIVMVGALLGTKQLPLEVEDIKAELRENLPPDRLEVNFEALARGMKAIAESKQFSEK